MHKEVKLSIIVILFPVLIFSCARQTAPTGGPKDTIPPVLINSYPRKGETNVNRKSIELEFTETIILANPKEQLIITPNIGKDYTVVAKKKRLVLQLENNLTPNTTYTFNFRDAVQDITEKNPATNLKLAFSTGTYIDSLIIQGKVTDLFKNKEVKDATVALYESDTFNIFQHKPIYFSKTDDKGIFQIENLKHGTFYLYAFEDRNRNLIVDSRTESFGFHSEPLILNKDTANLGISIVRLDSRPLKLTSSRPANTYYNIRTSKGLDNYSITAPDGDSIFTTYGDDKANIKVYNTFPNLDSLAVNLIAQDSIDNRIDTTLFVKFQTRQLTPEKFSFSLDPIRLTARTGILEAKGKFSKPIHQINMDSILFYIDSATVVNFTREDVLINNHNGTFRVRKQIPRNLLQESLATSNPAEKKKTKDNRNDKTNLLYFGKAAFISAEMDSTQKLEQTTKPLTIEDSGVIIVDIQTTRPHFIVELIDKSSTVVQTFADRKRVTFNDLIPGEYQVRVIEDTNGDGMWTPGNYAKKREPERIYFYANEKKIPVINLKANFELGPLLITF